MIRSKKILSVILTILLIVSLTNFMAFADDNYGDMIELDRSELISWNGVNDIYPPSAIVKLDDITISERVEAVLKTMTDAELYGWLGGGTSMGANRGGGGTGYMGGCARLGLPVLRFWDGPKGVTYSGDLFTTAPVSEVGIGATWSRDANYDYGVLTGRDNKMNRGNMQLGIQIDLIRSPHFQRSRDTLSEDAFLSGTLGIEFGFGIEDNNVLACLKHMAGYSIMFSTGDRIQIAEQALHEFYLQPYERITKAGASHAIMSSYNWVNQYKENRDPYIFKNVLRQMWGYEGLVCTDWGGSDAFSVPMTTFETSSISRNTRAACESAIAAGTITKDDVINAVRWNLTAWGKIGYLGLVKVKQNGECATYPAGNVPSTIELRTLTGQDRFDQLEELLPLALDGATKGAVLLKNNNNVLPLTGGSIAFVGQGAQTPLIGHGSESSAGWAGGMVSPAERVQQVLGSNGTVTVAEGINFVGDALPSEYLFTTADCDVNGVVRTQGESVTILSKAELTVGTVDGLTTGHYKNYADGNAVVNGESAATLTTYFKAPETGSFSFKLSGYGGARSYTMRDVEADTQVASLGNTTSNGSPATKPGIYGMDSSAAAQTVSLVKDKVYLITINVGAATSALRDHRVALRWYPSTAEASLQAAEKAAADNDTVVLFLDYNGAASGTGGSGSQRGSLALADASQNTLINRTIAAAKAKGNKIVVVMNIGLPVLMPWMSDVDAILCMWLPGQLGGMAVGNLLTGVDNPSGKLPITFPLDDATAQLGNLHTPTVQNAEVLKFYEGIYCGYRYYDKYNVPTAFDFGHGLSYTTFAYSDLVVSHISGATDIMVTFTVTNTGSKVGSEVAEVYLGAVNVPDGIQMAKYQLAQFTRLEDMQPGESRTVSLIVDELSLSYWPATTQVGVEGINDLVDVNNTESKWTVAEGEREIFVGGKKPPRTGTDSGILSASIEIEKATGSVNKIKAHPGETVTVPLCASQVDNLAGFSGVIKYNESLLTLQGITASDNFLLLNTGGKAFVAASATGYSGDVIVGYAVFKVNSSVVDDIVTTVEVPKSRITAFNASGVPISAQIIPTEVTIEGQPPLPGDVNLDGKVDLADAIRLLQYLAGNEVFSPRQLKAADVNGDGNVSVSDVVIIMSMCMPT